MGKAQHRKEAKRLARKLITFNTVYTDGLETWTESNTIDRSINVVTWAKEILETWNQTRQEGERPRTLLAIRILGHDGVIRELDLETDDLDLALELPEEPASKYPSLRFEHRIPDYFFKELTPVA